MHEVRPRKSDLHADRSSDRTARHHVLLCTVCLGYATYERWQEGDSKHKGYTRQEAEFEVIEWFDEGYGRWRQWSSRCRHLEEMWTLSLASLSAEQTREAMRRDDAAANWAREQIAPRPAMAVPSGQVEAVAEAADRIAR